MREVLHDVINHIVSNNSDLSSHTRIRGALEYGLNKCIDHITDGCYIDEKDTVELLELVCQEYKNLIDKQEIKYGRF